MLQGPSCLQVSCIMYFKVLNRLGENPLFKVGELVYAKLKVLLVSAL